MWELGGFLRFEEGVENGPEGERRRGELRGRRVERRRKRGREPGVGQGSI